MTQYERGSNFERRVKKEMEARGFFVVRAAGSHGPADLVAIGNDKIILISCKLTGKMTRNDLHGLLALRWTHKDVVLRMAFKGLKGKVEFVDYE